ncbi:MAG: efflux RND transporter periplasmic adaptor subunit [Gammaproteobacteria bacterium]
MIGQDYNRPVALALATVLLQLPATPLHAQSDSYDCVMEAKSTIELQSAEEGILDRVLVERGYRVKAGEIVARLESEQQALTVARARLRAEGQTGIDAAKAQNEFRRKEAERLEGLRSTAAIPERDYVTAVVESRLAEIAVETAEMEHDIAKLEYEQAKSLLERRSIRSPVEGVVVDVTMFPGEYVHEQATVMTIAEIDPLFVEVFMPVAQYETVQPGMPANVMPESPIGGSYDAEVAVVDNVFDAASRTFRVRLVLPNADYALPAGLRCTVRFLRSDSGT